MSSESVAVTSSANLERLIGRVKWFNNKAGYGFISVTDGPRSGTDVFVHHTSIGVSSQQYKYLVQGEYVEFDLTSVEEGTHEFQSANVVGIKGGKLMCETRNELKNSRNSYKSSKSDSSNNEQVKEFETTTVPKQKRPPRQQSTVSKQPETTDKGVWTLVKGGQTKPKGRGRPPRSAPVQSTESS